MEINIEELIKEMPQSKIEAKLSLRVEDNSPKVFNYTSWRDADDNIISEDCNIYAPKYGYVDNTFFKTYHYRDSKGNPISTNIKPLYCLCVYCKFDKNGEEVKEERRQFNKDGVEVFFIEKEFVHKYKTADCQTDYKKVWERELERDKPKNLSIYKQEFINLLESIIVDFETMFTPNERVRNSDLKALYIDFKKWIEGYDPDTDTQKNVITVAKSRKYTAKEYALAYLIDLHINGRQIPTKITEGGYDKQELIKIGKKKYGLKLNDTFYKAVKELATTYDLNNIKQLQAITNDWYDVLVGLTEDIKKTETYLKEKGLSRDK